MRAVIWEPNHKGHYLTYVALVARGLHAIGVEVVLATTQAAAASSEFANNIRPHGSWLRVDPWMAPELPAGPRGAGDRASRISESVARARADHLFIMHADRVATGVTLRRLFGAPLAPTGIEAEGLYFTSGLSMLGATRSEKIKQRVLWRFARRLPLARFHHLDPRALDRIRLEAPDEAVRWSLSPDPVERPAPCTRAEARHRLGLPEGGRIIGCPGLIDRRKGCDLLLRAFERAKRTPGDRLLFLGPQDEAMRSIISRDYSHLKTSGELLEVDRVFKPAELGEGVAAMDVVATLYPTHQQSASVVIRAAAAARPVLAAPIGWMEYTVSRFNLGTLADPMNAQTLPGAIMTALDGAPSWCRTPAAERFVRFHSPDNFMACWTARIRERLGHPAAAFLGWDWVLQAEEGEGAVASPGVAARA